MMKTLVIRFWALLFGTAIVLTGCQEPRSTPSKPAQPSGQTIGREYGETLHGAIQQANEAKSALEASRSTLTTTRAPGEE